MAVDGAYPPHGHVPASVAIELRHVVAKAVREYPHIDAQRFAGWIGMLWKAAQSDDDAIHVYVTEIEPLIEEHGGHNALHSAIDEYFASGGHGSSADVIPEYDGRAFGR